MIRAHIQLNTTKEAEDFVQRINSDGTVNKYTITDDTGAYRANARSLFGVIYAMSDFNERMYFINETEDGVFPAVVDKYRKS